MARLPAIPALLGISLGFVLALRSGSGDTFMPPAVQCYPAPHAGTAPAAVQAIAAVQPSTNDDDMVAAERIAMRTAVADALDATRACVAGTCDANAQHAMQSALKPYIAQRRILTARLFRERGAQGLELAHRIFATAQDAELTADLAQMYLEGRLDIGTYREDREALSLIALRPVASFRPCDALPRPSAWVY